MNQQRLIGVILFAALLAFELFNFDTTRFALDSLFGETSFLTLPWATILAVAFCGIDFAGLARLFVQVGDELQAANTRRPESGYLWGAWFLAAGMNAAMTWWAVSLSLLEHDFGNEVLSRAQILRFVPIFIAVLVWLTRILLIGAFSMASSQLLRYYNTQANTQARAAAGIAELRPVTPAVHAVAPAGQPVMQPVMQTAAQPTGRRGTVPGSLARVLGGTPAAQAGAPANAQARTGGQSQPGPFPMMAQLLGDSDEDAGNADGSEHQATPRVHGLPGQGAQTGSLARTAPEPRPTATQPRPPARPAPKPVTPPAPPAGPPALPSAGPARGSTRPAAPMQGRGATPPITPPGTPPTPPPASPSRSAYAPRVPGYGNGVGNGNGNGHGGQSVAAEELDLDFDLDD